MSIFLLSPGKDSHLAVAVTTRKIPTATIMKQEIKMHIPYDDTEAACECVRALHDISTSSTNVLLDVLVFLRLDGQILGRLDLYSIELD